MEQSEATLTLLFVDIVDSSRLYSERGDEKAQAIILGGVDILKDVVAQYYGTVIKTIGDEVMATFEDPAGAVKAALFMVSILKATPLSDEGDTVNVKVGLHTGSVILKDGDVFGNTVNTAARIVAQAKPRQVLVSGQTKAAIGANVPATTRFVDHLNLKGITEIFDLYEILSADVEDVENMTFVVDKEDADEMLTTYVVSHAASEIILDANNPTVRCGRDPANHVIVNEKAISRFHARLDWEKGKLTLTDQSINGTHVTFDDGESVHVHREKFTLSGAGTINLGRPAAVDQALLIKFRTR